MITSAIQAVSAALPSMPAMPSVGTADATGAASAAPGATGATGAAQSASGVEFGNLLSDGLDRLQGLQNTSSGLAVQAATGDATAIHDYTIAAAEASTATQLAVSLRNTGLQAFNSIMNMQI